MNLADPEQQSIGNVSHHNAGAPGYGGGSHADRGEGGCQGCAHAERRL